MVGIALSGVKWLTPWLTGGSALPWPSHSPTASVGRSRAVGADAPVTMTSPPHRRLFPWVQALRAIAALAVAFEHNAMEVILGGRDTNGLLAAVYHVMPWSSGVDIFFVISGFVIVHASADLFAKPGGGGRFLHRRLTRIVPLYWLLTTLFLAMQLFATVCR